MKHFDPADPQGLVQPAAEAHRRYAASGTQRVNGFLAFLFRELATDKRWDSELDLTPQVEWAARVVECVRAGLGDKSFSRLIEGISDILAELTDDAEPASVR